MNNLQELDFLKRRVDNTPTSSKYHYELAKFYLDHNDHKLAMKSLKNSFDLYTKAGKQDEKFKLDLYLLQIKIEHESNYPIDDIRKTYLKISELMRSNNHDLRDDEQEIINFLEEIKKTYFEINNESNTKILSTRRQEGKAIYDLIEQSNKQNYMNEEALPVNIISMEWFKKWKKLHFFHEFSHEKPEDLDEEYSEDDEEDENPKVSMEPITNKDILIKEEFLKDPDDVKNYCNLVLKEGLEENKDFIIVPHNVWKHLHKIYGGNEIKRFIVSVNDDSNLTFIEVWLKKINIVFFPNLTSSEHIVENTFLSKKETIRDLKEKMFRIYKNKYDLGDKYKNINLSKIWKLDSNVDISQTLNRIKNIKNSLIIKAKKLDDSLSLEDSEISENDTLIIEYKLKDEWLIINEEKIQKLEKNHCGYCKAKSTQNTQLYYCECKQIKYCNYICQKNHRQDHKDKCLKVRNELNNTHKMLQQFGINLQRKYSKDSKKGLVGLQNLGNTCFMNSSLQCLANTQELTLYFLANEFLKDMNKINPLGTGGYLSAAYSELLKDLHFGGDNYVTPWDLKKVIGKFAPQFSGYNQQDSQELLSYLLDGLHEDLNKVLNKPFVEDIEYNNQEDHELATLSWNNYLKRNMSVIVDLFAGQYKSKLTCPDCGKISITFDPFLSISLPVPHTNFSSFQTYFIFLDTNISPYKIQINLPVTLKLSEFIELLSEHVEIAKENITPALIKSQKIIDYPSLDWTMKQCEDHEAFLFFYETYSKKMDYILKPPFLNLEINIYSHHKKEDVDREISFGRLLKIPCDMTFEKLHFHLYKIFRTYLNNFRESILNQEALKDFPIDIEKKDKQTLLKEIEGLFSNSKYSPPYKLYILNQKIRVEVPNNKRDFSEFMGKTGSLELQLIFASFIKIETLKLNKCQESPFNLKQKERKDTDIYQCLNSFTQEEVLDQNNEWYCNVCKKLKQAKKKMEIYKTPKILILHFKRFKTSKISSIGSYYYTSGSHKIDNNVDFPIKPLKMKSYIHSKEQVFSDYELFAISNHYGGMHGGHYTAMCKNFNDSKWYEFNDSRVEEIEEDKLVSEGAYVLFYRRIENNSEGN